MSEEWRDVIGYEGYYQVSNLGKVKRVKAYRATWPGRILKPKVTVYGYHEVTLSRDNVRKSHKVHTLVAEAFIGPIPDGYHVNHLNGRRTHNVENNLEIVTPGENYRHAVENFGAGRGAKNGNSELSRDDVRKIRELYTQRRHTLHELGEMFDVHYTTVQCVISGKTWAWLDGWGEEPTENYSRGTNNRTSKLNADKVREIRKQHKRGITTISALSREYGVSRAAIRAVVNRKTWKHVD